VRLAVPLVIGAVVGSTLVWANWPEHGVDAGVVADKLVVRKAERRLIVLSHGQPVKSYRISLGHDPIGKKEREGDGKTPEGSYVIDFRKEHSSCCYRSFHISYPDAADRASAAAIGASPGGSIMVHGLSWPFFWAGRLHRLYDWTDGCVAVTNQEMAELWRIVPVGTPIEIQP
jgi:murein L,D-transpeptidase YafK